MLIEELYNSDLGFHLFEMTEEWHVWEMQYCEAQAPEKINILTMYPETTRTFTLLEGDAFLLAARQPDTEPEIRVLQSGRTYQIATGIWHNISLTKNTRILVTENNASHFVPKQYHQTIAPFYEALKKHMKNLT